MDPFTIGAIAQGGNMLFQTLSNIGQKKYNEKMYERQRSDSIADWNMQNEYNSPANQMKRLKEAGLNPHLVYGNGAVQQSPNVRSSAVESYKPSAPQVDQGSLQNSLMLQYNMNQRDAQTKLLQEQIELAKQEQMLKAIQGANMTLQGNMTQFDLNMKKELAATTIETARENLNRIVANVDYTRNQDRRSESMTNSNLAMNDARIENLGATNKEIQARINNMGVENDLKRLELSLRNKGINPNDPAYIRLADQAIQKLSQYDLSPKAFKTWVDEKIRNIANYLQTHSPGR